MVRDKYSNRKFAFVPFISYSFPAPCRISTPARRRSVAASLDEIARVTCHHSKKYSLTSCSRRFIISVERHAVESPARELAHSRGCVIPYASSIKQSANDSRRSALARFATRKELGKFAQAVFARTLAEITAENKLRETA